MAASKPRRRRRSLYSPFRRNTAPGAVSGSIVPGADSQHPVIRLISYNEHEFDRQDEIDVARATGKLHPSRIVWLDIDGLGDAKIVGRIGERFGLHALALEDAVNLHQRAKVEIFEEHLFIVSRMVSLKNGHLETEQIAIFLNNRSVVTFQERLGDCLDPVRQRLSRPDTAIRRRGPDYLVYALLDAIIDGYFPVVEAFGSRLDELEGELEQNRSEGIIPRLHSIRSELLMLRRSLWPQREAVAALMRDEHQQIAAETRLYLRDVYDHVVQLIDVTETYREVCADLRDLYYAQISQRTNDVMRVLTIIATVFMPLSFVAGLYGMNFDPSASPYSMPELGSRFGYPIVVSVMVTIALTMLFQFYRRGWLRRSG